MNRAKTRADAKPSSRRPGSARPPVKGAVRCYPLAPAGMTTKESWEWIVPRLKARGFEPIEEGFGPLEGSEGGLWILWQVWAIPPNGKGE